MKSNEHIKKFPPGEIPKCAKNQIWEAGDKNWSLGPASTGSIQKPGQPTNEQIKPLLLGGIMLLQQQCTKFII